MSNFTIQAEPGDRPPHDAKRIYRWADLPSATEPACYTVDPYGEDRRVITVSRHMRQVLEGLINQPIFAASYCRISDQILPLRRDHGLAITCTMYRNDPETGRERYGVYTLETKVIRAREVTA
jgi:hypothetical protein